MNASFWSEVTPPISAFAPAGSFSALIFDCSSVLTAPVLAPAGLAVMAAARRPSIRVSDTGPSTSSTVAMSPSLTGPRRNALSWAGVVAGLADFTTTSRSVSSRTAFAAVVPRTAWATAAPSFWSSKPAAAALALAFTEIRGTLVARSLVTSVTWSRPATAERTCSAAVRRACGSAAFTRSSRRRPGRWRWSARRA